MKPSRQKILAVFGTRPEAIKLAPLIRELQSDPVRFRTSVCVTTQHRSMLNQVLTTFEITPDYDLHVMQDGQDLFQVTTRCLERLRPVLEQERPDWVLVQGDTTTTFVAALAACYMRIRIGHVEAGLRTGDKSQPFPEEMNRRLTSHLGNLHFALNSRSKQNLLREGIPEQSIHVTGNTGTDALFYLRERSASVFPSIPGLQNWRGEKPLVLVTCHRRESFGEGFKRVCQALRQIALRGDVDLIYPVHLNPNVQQPVKSILGDLPNVFLIDPLDYDLPPVVGPLFMLVHKPLQPGGAERNPAVTAGSLPGLAAGSLTRCAGELCYTPAAIPQSTPSLPARCRRSPH